MKKEWMEPVVEVQEFAANEYVAACGDSGKVYKFVCDACDERKDRHGDECQRQIEFDHTDHCHHDTDQAF